MKKMLKLLAIGMLAFIVVTTAVISGYILINKNKTYYIYDVRIVKPIAYASYFLYTDENESYELMQNKVCYMKNHEENKFEIGIYVNISTKIDSDNFNYESSNRDVADVYPVNGHLFVYYFMAGEAEIIARVGDVSDRIKVTVYDSAAENMVVFDEAYYGEEYKENYPNSIVSYADDNVYSYKYRVSDFEADDLITSNDTDNYRDINSDNFIIDFDKEIFKNVYIDSKNKTLNVICKSTKTVQLTNDNGELVFDENGFPKTTEVTITENNDAAIYIQSVLKTKIDGNMVESVVKNYIVNVHIVADIPQYVQILLSTTPDFENDCVYVYTQNHDNEVINVKDKDIVDEILANKKEKTYLTLNNEKEFYNVFFTEKISTIYIRIRKIYTNGKIVYLDPLTRYEEREYIDTKIQTPSEQETLNDENSEEQGNAENQTELDEQNTENVEEVVSITKTKIVDVHPFTITTSNDDYFQISKNQNYYILKIDREYFYDENNEIDENKKYVISVSLDDYPDVSKDFEFTYKKLNKDNVEYFYDVERTYDDNNELIQEVYTYKYWDPRTTYDSEIYNTNGQIIDFAGE